jgi:hypothetical protein
MAANLITAFKKSPDFKSGDELNADMLSSLRGNRGLKSAEDVIAENKKMNGEPGEKTPPTYADILKMQEEDRLRREKKKTHPTKGTARQVSHVSVEEYDREQRSWKKRRDEFIGNEPSKLPDVSVMQGQRPLSPEKVTTGEEPNK